MKQECNDKLMSMLSLPFNVKSIEVKNTGFSDENVDGVVWIDEKRIEIINPVDCVYDDGQGGTVVGRNTEFEWSFVERDSLDDAYVLITLKNNNDLNKYCRCSKHYNARTIPSSTAGEQFCGRCGLKKW